MHTIQPCAHQELAFQRGFQRQHVVLISAAVLLCVLIAWYLAQKSGDEFEVPPQEKESRQEEQITSIDTSAWVPFASERYDVTMRHPKSWAVATSAGGIAPMITIYKPGDAVEETPPYDHFVNATHVSIYPEGIPTEGLFGERQDMELTLVPRVADGTTYVLRDATPFATQISFVDKPASWGPAGFVWARVRIDSMEVECLRDGAVISQERCDPLFGDVVTRTGKTNTQDRRITLAMLQSLRFPEGGVSREEIAPPVRAIDEVLSVAYPNQRQVITSPLSLSGEALGPWLAEAGLSVELYDATGTLLVRTTVTANQAPAQSASARAGTPLEEIVFPVSATLAFDTPETETGTLVLRREDMTAADTPAQEMRITVVFEEYSPF